MQHRIWPHCAITGKLRSKECLEKSHKNEKGGFESGLIHEEKLKDLSLHNLFEFDKEEDITVNTSKV